MSKLICFYLYFSNYVARKQGVKKCAYIRGEIENKIIFSQLATFKYSILYTEYLF